MRKIPLHHGLCYLYLRQTCRGQGPNWSELSLCPPLRSHRVTPVVACITLSSHLFWEELQKTYCLQPSLLCLAETGGSAVLLPASPHKHRPCIKCHVSLWLYNVTRRLPSVASAESFERVTEIYKYWHEWRWTTRLYFLPEFLVRFMS